MRQLGCKIGDSLDSLDGKFSHPSTDSAVYFIPDPCHMLKLARNALADVKVFRDHENKIIKWEPHQLAS